MTPLPKSTRNSPMTSEALTTPATRIPDAATQNSAEAPAVTVSIRSRPLARTLPPPSLMHAYVRLALAPVAVLAVFYASETIAALHRITARQNASAQVVTLGYAQDGPSPRALCSRGRACAGIGVDPIPQR